MKLGDTIEVAVKPFAQVLHMDCFDTTGNLKPESTCAQRRDSLNNLGDSVWDFLWPNTKKK